MKPNDGTTGSAIRRGRLLAAVIAVGLSFCAAASAAEKVTIVVGGLEKQIYLPAMLCQRLGYFKEEGLDVDLVSSRAGVDAENELVAGAADAVVGFYDHTIDLQSKGKFIQTIVQLSSSPGEVELVSSKLADKITSPAGFKGMTLGVSGLGSSTDFLTRYLAARAGLSQGDYTLLPVGASDTFIAAMKQGAIQAGMTTEPTVGRLLKTGDARVLADLRTPEKTMAAMGGLYPAASLYVSARWLEKNHDTAQKLANAFVKTMDFIATHDAAAIADKMPQDYYAGDKAVYVSGLADGKAQFTRDGRMPEGGPETVLKILASFSKTVQGKKIDLSKTYTNEFTDAAAKLTRAAN